METYETRHCAILFSAVTLLSRSGLPQTRALCEPDVSPIVGLLTFFGILFVLFSSNGKLTFSTSVSCLFHLQ
jgi:hypothetical protein